MQVLKDRLGRNGMDEAVSLDRRSTVLSVLPRTSVDLPTREFENRVQILDLREAADKDFGCHLKWHVKYWISDRTQLLVDGFSLCFQKSDLFFDICQIS
jgi:hypothetical protein